MPRIDLGGAVAVPAFGDTHMHFESFSTFENTFNISDAHSFDEAAAIVRTYAEAHPREKLLIGFGACGHLVRGGPSAQPRGPGPLGGATAHHRQI